MCNHCIILNNLIHRKRSPFPKGKASRMPTFRWDIVVGGPMVALRVNVLMRRRVTPAFYGFYSSSFVSVSVTAAFFFLLETAVMVIEITEATSAVMAMIVGMEPSLKIEPTTEEFLNFA